MSSLTLDELNQMMLASKTFNDAYWREFAKVGPRHKNVKRWVHDLGWNVSPAALDAYLAPEVPHHG